jgi:hypothetical protein
MDNLARIADNIPEEHGQLNFVHPLREGNGRSQRSSSGPPARRPASNSSSGTTDRRTPQGRLTTTGDPSLLKEHFQAITKGRLCVD